MRGLGYLGYLRVILLIFEFLKLKLFALAIILTINRGCRTKYCIKKMMEIVTCSRGLSVNQSLNLVQLLKKVKKMLGVLGNFRQQGQDTIIKNATILTSL